MVNIGVRLNFSGGAHKQGQKLSYLEPGKYDAVLKSMKFGQSKSSGKDMYTAEWNIVSDEFTAWPVREWYTLDEASLWKWHRLLSAANIEVNDDEDLELDDDDIRELIGLEVVLELEEDDPFVNNKGETVQKNKITGITGR